MNSTTTSSIPFTTVLFQLLFSMVLNFTSINNNYRSLLKALQPLSFGNVGYDHWKRRGTRYVRNATRWTITNLFLRMKRIAVRDYNINTMIIKERNLIIKVSWYFPSGWAHKRWLFLFLIIVWVFIHKVFIVAFFLMHCYLWVGEALWRSFYLISFLIIFYKLFSKQKLTFFTFFLHNTLTY